jgi:hypothetical protein
MIHANVLLSFVRSGRPVRFSGLPADARLVGANYDVNANQFVCLVESVAFALVPDGEVIPEIAAVVEHGLADDDVCFPVRRVRLSGGKLPESAGGK